MAADAHVREIVRAGDPDRYLATLYAPEDKRPALFALYAFHVETARVRDLVREPLPGEIRLQWWRDAIAAGQPTGSPVADALIAAIDAYRLPVAAFEAMLEARVFDLYDDPMPDRTTLEGYCGETGAALIQLAALVLDAETAAGQADLAGHAGCAQTMTGLLQDLSRHRARGQCYVPADLLAAVGTDREAFLSNDDDDGVGRAVAAMLALARDHFGAFLRDAPSLPASLRPAFLPLAVIEASLDRIESKGVDAPAPSALRRHWLILRRATGGW
ncbi:phytoene/squalene synthase family protein [Nitratireductor alexandrii]|uniref:phytoene/squalene synthase family protein n=1 Tax=Nitratireductor alexandrii TaxID=2448161 RepID=UPI000FD6D85D|nr:phytoene/squalene synthase family protein [Nitratireductor alexandrii]